MGDVVAIVEGQTEQTFVRDLLAVHLGARGIAIWPRLPGRRKRHGGTPNWESLRGDILRTLKERDGRICTTMFDFYAMPVDWPGRTEAGSKRLSEKGPYVEQALLDDLTEHAGSDFRQELFVPYVQVHEFEALLFADVDELGRTLAPVCRVAEDRLAERFRTILDECGEPEAINDNYDTCPSRRVTGIVRAYKKPLYGPIIAGRIGLDTLRGTCPHFGQWLDRLESLAA